MAVYRVKRMGGFYSKGERLVLATDWLFKYKRAYSANALFHLQDPFALFNAVAFMHVVVETNTSYIVLDNNIVFCYSGKFKISKIFFLNVLSI